MTLNEARARFQVQGIDDSFFGDSSGQEEAFRNCLAFLGGVEKTDTIRGNRTSYGMKHVVERAFQNCYVYEGTFILAALSLGFKCRYGDKASMTCKFNMGSASLKRREMAFQEPRRPATW